MPIIQLHFYHSKSHFGANLNQGKGVTVTHHPILYMGCVCVF